MNTARLTAMQTENTAHSSTSSWRDWVGIVASIGCAIHCAAMPFVIAYLPMLGLSFLADEAFHKWMALVCFLIAIAAFVPGVRKHGNWTPISIGALGIVLITFAAFGLAGECCASCDATTLGTDPSSAIAAESTCSSCDQCTQCTAQTATAVVAPVAELNSLTPDKKDLLATLAPWITPLGGMLLVSAHLLNRRSGCQCGCCETE